MLIDTFTLNRITDTYVSVAWTATDLTKTCWLYNNGILIGQYLDGTTLAREVEFSVKEDQYHLIEIHEAQGDDPETGIDESDPVETITVVYEDYDLKWNRVPEAVYYEIFHTVANGVERKIKTVYQQDDVSLYIRPAPELEREGGIWHHFRVESVDEWENRSVRKQWHYFVYGRPPVPESVIVTGGSGVFDITVNL